MGTDDIDLIMEYLKRYDASIDKFAAIIEDLVKRAMSYYRDIILPNKKHRTPTEEEREIFRQQLEDYSSELRGDKAEQERLNRSIEEQTGKQIQERRQEESTAGSSTDYLYGCLKDAGILGENDEILTANNSNSKKDENVSVNPAVSQSEVTQNGYERFTPGVYHFPGILIAPKTADTPPEILPSEKQQQFKNESEGE